MAPKDRHQRINEENMAASQGRLTQINTGVNNDPMPTDMEYAVMRLRSAAYALRGSAQDGVKPDEQAALILARDAFVLADAALSAQLKREHGALSATLPVTKDGVTQQVERVKTEYIKTTEYKVLFSPWTWLKLKLRRQPTLEIYKDDRKVWPSR